MYGNEIRIFQFFITFFRMKNHFFNLVTFSAYGKFQRFVTSQTIICFFKIILNHDCQITGDKKVKMPIDRIERNIFGINFGKFCLNICNTQTPVLIFQNDTVYGFSWPWSVCFFCVVYIDKDASRLSYLTYYNQGSTSVLFSTRY